MSDPSPMDYSYRKPGWLAYWGLAVFALVLFGQDAFRRPGLTTGERALTLALSVAIALPVVPFTLTRVDVPDGTIMVVNRGKRHLISVIEVSDVVLRRPRCGIIACAHLELRTGARPVPVRAIAVVLNNWTGRDWADAAGETRHLAAVIRRAQDELTDHGFLAAVRFSRSREEFVAGKAPQGRRFLPRQPSRLNRRRRR